MTFLAKAKLGLLSIAVGLMEFRITSRNDPPEEAVPQTQFRSYIYPTVAESQVKIADNSEANLINRVAPDVRIGSTAESQRTQIRSARPLTPLCVLVHCPVGERARGGSTGP